MEDMASGMDGASRPLDRSCCTIGKRKRRSRSTKVIEALMAAKSKDSPPRTKPKRFLCKPANRVALFILLLLLLSLGIDCCYHLQSARAGAFASVVVAAAAAAAAAESPEASGGGGGGGAGYPPTITIQPNDLIAIEGESTELNCDAEGEPKPTIEWYHNGQLIKASTHSRTTMAGSIQFLDIRSGDSSSSDLSKLASGQQPAQSDAGIYHCLARNSLGQARSRNASLQVAYIKHEFRSAPKDKLANLGETVTFDCLPEAWPEPTIQWRRNGKPIGHYIGEPAATVLANDGLPKYSTSRLAAARVGSQNDNQSLDLFGSQLQIRQVDKNDEGRYSCLVETKATHSMIERESPAGQLLAQVRPYFIEAPQDRSVEMGGQVRLRCKMGGDPEPVISWRKQNGQPLSQKAQIDPTDKTLTLDQVTIFDQAVYVCEGENSIGSARSLAKVHVTSRPRFTAQPEDQAAELGARIQMRCSGEGNPHPMLYWYKEGHRQLMFAPNLSQQSVTSPKTPPSALEWPQAPLALVSDNRLSSDTSPAINKLFTALSADQPPGGFGNSFFGNRIYVDNHGTLHIINATASDTGYYACALVSSVGSVLAKAKVTIKHQQQQQQQPQQLTSDYLDPFNARESQHSRSSSSSSPLSALSKLDLLPPPVIKLGNINETLPINTSTVLVCDVVSQVPYKIQWLFDSQPIQEEPGRVVVQETGSLSINNLKPSDSGIYTCVVTAANDQFMPMASPSEPLDSSMLTSAPPIQQSTSHSTWLKVANPKNPNMKFIKMDVSTLPSAPGPAILVSTNGLDAITIAWTPPADSGSLPLKEYIVEHYDTAQEHAGWRVIYRIKGKESLLVDGLSSDGSHFFVIRAVSGRGTGPSSSIAGPFRTNAFLARYDAEFKRHGYLDQGRFGNDGLLQANSFRPDSRDLARERLMKIITNLVSLTPVSSSSVRLQWSTQARNSSDTAIDSIGGSDVDDILEGFSVRYRPVGIGSGTSGEFASSSSGWSPYQMKDQPSSLPLVTSYVEEESDPSKRTRRDIPNLIDYSQEFNEVRVVDRSTEQYTINGLEPFTVYQFFVVPYYKDIDGVPSNILTAQTEEDRPSVAPPYLTVRFVNSTAVRLLWLHIPQFANGILRGYLIQVNRTANDVADRQTSIESTKYLNAPLSDLSIVALTPESADVRIPPATNSPKYVVMYELSNLTYKSFYSIQVAATTSVGSGPWSATQNFIMDPRMSEPMATGGDPMLAAGFGDLISKSLIPAAPQNYHDSLSSSTSLSQNVYMALSIVLSMILIVAIVGYALYYRNNQRVLTWRKTISEHFTNKFYMPSTVDQHRGSNSIQQNIYDHQQHLIYSGSTHIPAQSIPQQTMWQPNNGCINSSGTGSLSSHGGLLPISNDPNNLNRRIVGEQVFLMNNNKDMTSRFSRGVNGQLNQQQCIDTACTLGQPQKQIVNHGDYYSVINNMGEYEELDTHQAPSKSKQNGDRHQTASSNSDTSCPSSVTRLLPNQNYNRDLLAKTYNENQRLEMIVQQQQHQQQQANFVDKPQFVAMNNGSDGPRLLPLSPYATTNLMSQMPQQQQQQQIFVNPHQMNFVDHTRQQNFIALNGGCAGGVGGGMTMDDSSKALMNQQQQQQQLGGIHNQVSSFRTLQRNVVNFHQRAVDLVQQSQQQQPHIFAQADTNNVQFRPSTNIISNPLGDGKANLYEHVDYSTDGIRSQPTFQSHKFQPHTTQVAAAAANDIISPSTSSGSVRSNSQQRSPVHHQQPHHHQQTSVAGKSRRGSAAAAATINGNAFENEAHDLRVFSNSRQAEPINEASKLNPSEASNEIDGDDDEVQVDETTAFRSKAAAAASQDDQQRNRQLSKRKRQQQRNRLHNNNQKII